MPALNRSRQIAGHAEEVWQELTDFRTWASLSAHFSHVELISRAEDSVRLECRDVTGQTFLVDAKSWQNEQRFEIVVDANTPHPLGIHSVRFDLTDNENSVMLHVSADYYHRIPVFGSWLEKFGRQAQRIEYLESLLEALSLQTQKRHWKYKENVRSILSRKGHAVITAAPEAPISQLAASMSQKRIGVILIADANDELVGLVSERDIVNCLSSDGVAVLEKTAADIMTRNLIVVDPGTDLMFVMACMTENKVRHLPVLEEGKLVGLVSIGDVVQQRLHSLEADSATMRDYIAAREWRYHSPNGAPLPSSSAGDGQPSNVPVKALAESNNR